MSRITDDLNHHIDITSARFDALHSVGKADHAANIAILRDELAAVIIAIRQLDARIDRLTQH